MSYEWDSGKAKAFVAVWCGRMSRNCVRSSLGYASRHPSVVETLDYGIEQLWLGLR